MHLYFLPGLGFDQRIFRNLDLGEYRTTYINWIDPLVGESIREYAIRLANIHLKEEKEIILTGHSFGGILCQEIAQFTEIKKVIIVSSIKSRSENPMHFKLIAPLGLHRFFGKSLTLNTFPLWAKRHGYKLKEEQILFKDMVRQHSDRYLRWALRELSRWKEPESNKTHIVQIHGANDRSFPIHLVAVPDYIIEKGGHFMVYQQPDVISRIIKKEINF